MEVEPGDANAWKVSETVAQDVQVRNLDVGRHNEIAAVHHARHVSRSGADLQHAIANPRLDAFPDPFVVSRQTPHPLERDVAARFGIAFDEETVLEDRPDGRKAVL